MKYKDKWALAKGLWQGQGHCGKGIATMHENKPVAESLYKHLQVCDETSAGSIYQTCFT